MFPQFYPQFPANYNNYSQHRNPLTLLSGKDFSQIPVDSILYIDTVDNQTFLYTNSDTYYSKQKLYELENQLAEMEFIRISKNTIVNLHQIEQVKSFGISKLELILTNEEKLIVNRNYLYAFKQKFMA